MRSEEEQWVSWDDELKKMRQDLYTGVAYVDYLLHRMPPSEENKEKLREQMKVLQHDISQFGKLITR